MKLKTALQLLLVSGLFLLGAERASAQSETPKPKKFSISIGGFYPKGQDAKDAGTPHLLTVLSYDLNGSGSGPFSYGVFSESSYRKKDGNKFTCGALGIQGRLLLGNRESGLTPYVSVRLGGYSVKSEPSVGAEVDESRFGGYVGAGLELRSGFIAEAGYRWVQSAKGVDGSGFLVTIGWRF